MGLTIAYSALFPPTGLCVTPPPSNGFGNEGTSVAQFALQIAKISGFSPIITTASLKHKDALVELGATHVLDRAPTTEQIKAENPETTSKPLKYAFDTVSGAPTQWLALDVLATDGTTAFVLLSDVTATNGKKIVQAFASLRAAQRCAPRDSLPGHHLRLA